MPLNLTNTFNVTDAGALELLGAFGTATAVVGGTTYLFVSGSNDNGVSVFSVAADGGLTNVFNVTDDATLNLFSAAGLATAVVGGTTYLFVSGFNDDGVSVFSVGTDGSLTNVFNVADDATLRLLRNADLTAAAVGGTTYLFVTGRSDDGVSVFSVAANGSLTNVFNVADFGPLNLDSADGPTTAVVGGTTYLFVAGTVDDGVSVFSVAANGSLANVFNVNDDATLELDGALKLTTAMVAGTTYLFVAGRIDDGISVFSVAADGSLTNVFNVSDDATLEIDGPTGLTTAVIGGTTYLFVTGVTDNGMSVFAVAANGALTNVANIADDATLQLFNPNTVSSAVVGGNTHVFVASFADSGVSVFTTYDKNRIDFNLDGKGDVLWQHDDGTAGLWSLNGLSVSSTSAVGSNPGPSWHAINAADFNGDSKSDILWQHNDGRPGIWFMNGSTVLSTSVIGTPALWATDNKVIDAGDFNGDGKADILWQHGPANSTTGPANAAGIWLMDGTTVVAHEWVGAPLFSSVGWTVIAAGDFNGDGKSDILWQRDNGQTNVWLMDGLTVVSQAAGSTPPGPSWHAIDTGDFNGDGKADILWQNDNGQAGIWLMNGLGALATANVGGNPGTSWNVIGANDINGDGKADILWQHDDGTAGAWLMDGTTVLATGVLGSNPGTSWNMIQPHDLVV